MRRPGRLYRSLKPSAPLFEFSVDDGTLITDDGLRSITIKRGKSGRGGGVHPATAEVMITGFGSVRSGRSCAVSLTSAGAALVAGLSGAGAAGIAPRFTGRIGRQNVEDDGKHPATSFLAASWSAQLAGDQRVHQLPKGMITSSAIGQLMTAPKLGLAAPVRMAATAPFGWLMVPQEGTYSELIGKFTTDLGILVRDTRSGGRQIMNHRFRQDRAISTLPSAPTLTRSQALSPASWEQANELQPRNYRLLYTDTANAVKAQIYGDTESTTAEVVDLDMSHIKWTTDVTQPTMEAFGRRAADWVSSYSIPSITVDLLLLITSPHAMHRAQAARLLAMEVGDPVYLSGDWYGQLQGIHYAEALNETITPDAWTVELSLVPSHVAVGEVSPAVPARTWEAASNSWNSEPRTWNNT